MYDNNYFNHIRSNVSCVNWCSMLKQVYKKYRLFIKPALLLEKSEIGDPEATGDYFNLNMDCPIQ